MHIVLRFDIEPFEGKTQCAEDLGGTVGRRQKERTGSAQCRRDAKFTMNRRHLCREHVMRNLMRAVQKQMSPK